MQKLTHSAPDEMVSLALSLSSTEMVRGEFAVLRQASDVLSVGTEVVVRVGVYQLDQSFSGEPSEGLSDWRSA